MDESEPGGNANAGTSGRPRHRLRNALLGLLACVVVLSLALAGAGIYLQNRLADQIDRVPGVFSSLPEESRPARPASDTAAEAVNILLMGTDRRSERQTTGAAAGTKTWVPGAQRSDTLMVLHIDGDRKGASVISIPRDSWVEVPGHGRAKINAAFSYEGPSLAVGTVEQLTGVRIDHLAVIDWDGFRRLTDALGGVEVEVPRTVHDSARDKTWTKGTHKLDGADTLLYVRQRYGLPGGDFDRVRRQQNVVRALMGKTMSRGVLSSPTKLYDVLDAVTENLSVDSGWSVGDMRGLALSMRHLRSDDVEFLTVPTDGTGSEGGQSVVYLDDRAGDTLWDAVRGDRVGEWAADHAGSRLGSTVG